MSIDPSSDIIFIDMNEFSYYKAGENVGIRASLNDEGGIYISMFDSQVDADQPRSPKGLARKRLCDLIKYFVDKGLIIKSSNISLRPGNIGGQEGSAHNQTKLEQMYKNMGFTKAKNGAHTMSISDFMKWCETKYGKEILEAIAAAPKPKKEKAIKKPKKSEIKKVDNNIKMSNLTVEQILETHPLKNLRGILSGVRKDILKVAGLSANHIRKGKAEMIKDILKLMEKGLIEKVPPVYVKPKRETEAEKRERVKATETPAEKKARIAAGKAAAEAKTQELLRQGAAIMKKQNARKAKEAAAAAPKKEKKPAPKSEKISFDEGGKRFRKIKKLFVELEKGLTQEQLKSFNNDVREYNKLDVNTSGDIATTDIKNYKMQLKKDYNRLYRIFLGKVKPKKGAAASGGGGAAAPKAKKPRTEKQKAADKKLGEAARARAAAKKANK